MDADLNRFHLFPPARHGGEDRHSAVIGDARAGVHADRRIRCQRLWVARGGRVAAPVGDVATARANRQHGEGAHADGRHLLHLPGDEVGDLHIVPTGGCHDHLIVGQERQAAGVGVPADKRFLQVDVFGGEGVLAVGLAPGDADLAVGVAGINSALVDKQADNAEPGLWFANAQQGQRLPDLAGRQVDELQGAVPFDHEHPALLGQGQIDRAAGEGDLAAGRLQNLVGGHHEAAIGLRTDLALVRIIGRTDQWHGQDGGEQSKQGNTHGKRTHGGLRDTRKQASQTL